MFFIVQSKTKLHFLDTEGIGMTFGYNKKLIMGSLSLMVIMATSITNTPNANPAMERPAVAPLQCTWYQNKWKTMLIKLICWTRRIPGTMKN